MICLLLWGRVCRKRLMEPHSWNGYEPNLGNVGYLQHTGCISVISPQYWIVPFLEESKT